MNAQRNIAPGGYTTNKQDGENAMLPPLSSFGWPKRSGHGVDLVRCSIDTILSRYQKRKKHTAAGKSRRV